MYYVYNDMKYIYINTYIYTYGTCIRTSISVYEVHSSSRYILTSIVTSEFKMNGLLILYKTAYHNRFQFLPLLLTTDIQSDMVRREDLFP